MSSYEANVLYQQWFLSVAFKFVFFFQKQIRRNIVNTSIYFFILIQRKKFIHYCTFLVFSYDCYIENKVVIQNSPINVLGHLSKTKYVHV